MILPVTVYLSLLVTLTAIGAAPVDEQTFLRAPGPVDVITHCNVSRTAALTFDDGPYLYTFDVVNELNKAGVKGTFFFNGNNYGCIYSGNTPDKVRYVVNNGHQAASHTWAHKNLTTLNWDSLHDEFWRVEQALMRIAGVRPAFMRPPYGSYNDLVRQVAAVRGQSVVSWDLDAGDAVGKTPWQSQAIYDDAIRRHPPTILALNHETYETTAHTLLPYAIRVLKAAGYRLVTVAECLDLPPYQSVGNPEKGSWTC